MDCSKRARPRSAGVQRTLSKGILSQQAIFVILVGGSGMDRNLFDVRQSRRRQTDQRRAM
jgi:hypothetical protein